MRIISNRNLDTSYVPGALLWECCVTTNLKNERLLVSPRKLYKMSVIEDKEAVREAYEDVRNDATETRWSVVSLIIVYVDVTLKPCWLV